MGMFDYVRVDPVLAEKVGLPADVAWQTKDDFPRGGDNMAHLTVGGGGDLLYQRWPDSDVEVCPGTGTMEIHAYHNDVRLDYELEFVGGVLARVVELRRGDTWHAEPRETWCTTAFASVPVTEALAAYTNELVAERAARTAAMEALTAILLKSGVPVDETPAGMSVDEAWQAYALKVVHRLMGAEVLVERAKEALKAISTAMLTGDYRRVHAVLMNWV